MDLAELKDGRIKHGRYTAAVIGHEGQDHPIEAAVQQKPKPAVGAGEPEPGVEEELSPRSAALRDAKVRELYVVIKVQSLIKRLLAKTIVKRRRAQQLKEEFIAKAKEDRQFSERSAAELLEKGMQQYADTHAEKHAAATAYALGRPQLVVNGTQFKYSR
jgi:hypothetical protein